MSIEHYWLRVAPFSNGPNEHNTWDSSEYHGMFVRFVGSGSPAVVLTRSPPPYFKSHLDEEKGHQLFTSWKHPDLTWSLRLADKDRLDSSFVNRPLWSAVEIYQEPGADDGFSFTSVTKDNPRQELIDTSIKGWMVCEWNYGLPQLFYLTEAFDETKHTLPSSCQRVTLAKSDITPCIDLKKGKDTITF